MSHSIRILVLVLLFPFTGRGQLVLTTEGLRDSIVPANNFVRVASPGKTPAELYENCLKYLTRPYKTPKIVISGQLENESIRFESYSSSISQFSFFVMNYIVACRYTVELSFTENELKYKVLSLRLEARPLSKPYDPSPARLLISGDNMNDFSIYKEGSGKLLKPTVKKDLEKYFNTELRTITAYSRLETKEEETEQR